MSNAERSTFPARLHLRRHRDFESVLTRGKRTGDRRLQIWALPNNLDYSRVGLIVGRRHGGAVRRNRIKRILREAFRLSRPRLPVGLDIACAPRVGAEMDLQKTMDSLVQLLWRVQHSFGSTDRRI